MSVFTEEHNLFRKSVRDYVEKKLKPHADEWEQAHAFPDEVFREMGELGFLGIQAPTEYGGSGLDYWYTVAFAEELTRSTMAGLNLVDRRRLPQAKLRSPSGQRRGDRRPRDQRARRRLRRRQHPDDGEARW